MCPSDQEDSIENLVDQIFLELLNNDHFYMEELYDEHGNLKPRCDWPEHIQQAFDDALARYSQSGKTDEAKEIEMRSKEQAGSLENPVDRNISELFGNDNFDVGELRDEHGNLKPHRDQPKHVQQAFDDALAKVCQSGKTDEADEIEMRRSDQIGSAENLTDQIFLELLNNNNFDMQDLCDRHGNLKLRGDRPEHVQKAFDDVLARFRQSGKTDKAKEIEMRGSDQAGSLENPVDQKISELFDNDDFDEGELYDKPGNLKPHSDQPDHVHQVIADDLVQSRRSGMTDEENEIEVSPSKQSGSIETPQEQIISELVNIAKFSVKELYDEHGKFKPLVSQPKRVLQAIADVQIRFCRTGKKDGAGRPIIDVSYQIKPHDRLKAIEKLGKRIGMF